MRARPSLTGGARAPDAEREGALEAGAGTCDVRHLAAEVQARFRVPARGGRRTDPAWTEKRLISLTPQTLRRLEQVARAMSDEGVTVGPLQVAALLLERAVIETKEATTNRLAEGRTCRGG